jgi:SAM-dependent methyltransferase
MSNPKSSFIEHFSSSITCKDDGIYYADSSDTISYPHDGNDNCFEVEENSFWFRHRNNCIIEIIKNFRSSKDGPIFDVGGGNGFVSKGLLDAGLEVVLVEPGKKGVINAKKRGIPHVICATTHTAKFQPGTIPSIGVFDVIEHIEDDIGFLKHLWKLLAPGGMLYLTVPAYQFLWSQEDVEGGHFRRYTLSNLKKKMMHSGFDISYSSYIFSYLPIFVFFLRTFLYKLNLSQTSTSDSIKQDHSSPKGIGSKILNLFHNWELLKIRARKRIPLGGSCMVAAKKSD